MAREVRMKKIIVILLLVASSILLSGAITLFAQQSAQIAVINGRRAFEGSAEGKKAIAQFQQRESKIRADIQKLDDSIMALQSRLNTGQLTMTKEAFAATQLDLEKKTTERKRYEEDATRDYGQFQQSLTDRIKAEMVAIIQALRKEKGYDLVFDLASSGVVDFEPALDITDEVIRRYDASKAATPPVKK
jgi:outer membrane protein